MDTCVTEVTSNIASSEAGRPVAPQQHSGILKRRKLPGYWPGFVLVMMLVLAACNGTPAPEDDDPGQGNLIVQIAGTVHPAADVTVTGPAGFDESLTGMGEFEFPDIETGTYSVLAPDVTDGADIYRPAVTPSGPIELKADEVVTVTVDYAPLLASLEVIIDGLTAVPAEVTVTGPPGYSESLTDGQTLTGLPPGDYSVSAANVVADSMPVPSLSSSASLPSPITA